MALLSRITACCLTVLVLAPFTAPFPTCDLAMLLGGSQTQHAPASAPASLASDVSVASVPAISHIGRVRLLQLSGLSESARASFSAAATLTLSSAPHGRLRDRAALSPVLRV
jgi:hypothetical protein